MCARSRIFELRKYLKQLGVNLFEFRDNLKKRCGSMVVCCSVVVVVDAAGVEGACFVRLDIIRVTVFCLEFSKFLVEFVEFGAEVEPF